MKPEELICKAQRKDNGEWIEGFYFCLHHNDGRTHLHHLIIPLEADLSRGTPLDQIQVEVVPESITLKAQEPRRPIKSPNYNYSYYGYNCSKCGHTLSAGEYRPNYCEECGQKVAWDD